VLGVVRDAVDLGQDAFDSTLNLPSAILDQINRIKHQTFDEWADWVRNGGIGRDILNGLNAAYDGVVEIAKASWELIQDACRLFNEYKSYINIGVQVIQQDYANAAANLTEEAALALGLPPVAQGTDSAIVRVADYVCAAVDGITLVAAAAAGIPPPPPLPPSNTLIVEDGVARPARFSDRLIQSRISIDNSPIIGLDPGSSPSSGVPAVAPAKKSAAPTVILGGAAVAALLLVVR